MPLYDMYCKTCNYQGEHLLPSSTTIVNCPNSSLHGALEKKISGFNIGSKSANTPNNNSKEAGDYNQISENQISENQILGTCEKIILEKTKQETGLPASEIKVVNHGIIDGAENIKIIAVSSCIRDPQRN